MQLCKYANIQIFKYANIQIYKYANKEEGELIEAFLCSALSARLFSQGKPEALCLPARNYWSIVNRPISKYSKMQMCNVSSHRENRKLCVSLQKSNAAKGFETSSGLASNLSFICLQNLASASKGISTDL